MMKRVLLFTIVICSLLFNSLVASASDYDASLSVDYTYDDDSGNIVITASIVDIKDPLGLIMVDYEIYYDHTVLELTDKYINIPEIWEPMFNKDAEDFSKENGAGVYTWSVLNSAKGYGITEDDELYVELTFKPLSNVKTDIAFECKYVVNDDTKELSGNDVAVSIDLSNPDDADIDEDADIKDIINNNTQSPDVSSDTPDDESFAVSESVGTEDDISDGSADSSVDNGATDLSNNEASINASQADDVSEGDGENSMIVWIVVVVILAVAAVATVLVLKNRKAK